jgi:hypothetical protein
MLAAGIRATVVTTALALGALGVAAPGAALAVGERPVAYVNPDSGKETENPGVAAGSGCESADQSDTMELGDEGTGSGNVHVDACLFDGDTRVDTQAAFEVSGVGVISGCPDADKDGPKTATKSGSTCVHTGFETDDLEYHVRVVSATAGVQTVSFCADPEGNGCSDAESTSTVRITWGAPQGGVAAGGGLPAPAGSTAVALLALGAAGTAAVAARAAGLGRASR